MARTSNLVKSLQDQKIHRFAKIDEPRIGREKRIESGPNILVKRGAFWDAVLLFVGGGEGFTLPAFSTSWLPPTVQIGLES